MSPADEASMPADVEALWPAQLGVLAALVLQLLLPNRLTLGPSWLIAALEGVLLVALVLFNPTREGGDIRWRRRTSLAVVVVVSFANLLALVLLAHYLLRGGHEKGHELILSGADIWLTNVILFGLWYWEVDRGGPVERARPNDKPPMFLFQQDAQPEFATPRWRAVFFDYLYTSYTNQTAFSPTDTMPLTVAAKTLMSIQTIASLVVTALVVARAVNILSG